MSVNDNLDEALDFMGEVVRASVGVGNWGVFRPGDYVFHNATDTAELLQAEIDATVAKLQRAHRTIAWRYHPRFELPRATLERRAAYGGRKGRSAARRLSGR